MSDWDGDGGQFDDDDRDWEAIWDELREMRAEPPSLSDERRDRIRATWQTQMALQMVQRAERARARRRRVVEFGAIAAVMTAIVLVLAITAPTHPDREEPRVATAPTSTSSEPRVVPTLEELASTALRQPSEVLGVDGRYAHRVEVRSGAPFSPSDPMMRESWIALDGSGRMISGASDRTPREDVVAGPGGLFLGDKLLPVDALTLPTEDVEALFARLRQIFDLPPDALGFGEVLGELLASAGVPSDLRAALIRALAAEGFVPAEEQFDEHTYAYEGLTGQSRLSRMVIVFGKDTVPRILRVEGAGGAMNAHSSFEAVELLDEIE